MNCAPEVGKKGLMGYGTRRVVLKVQGFHIPSFKNGKVLFVTNPRNRELMKRIQESFEGTLLYWYPTVEAETVTAQKLRSWIATSGPADDSCHFLTACSWSFITVPKGLAGAELYFERLGKRKRVEEETSDSSKGRTKTWTTK